MTASPVVTVTVSPPVGDSTAGTPKPLAAPPPSLDLAEQMNEEEKSKYVKGKKLGEGTYAIVYLGHVRDAPSTQVAIKKIKFQKEYTQGMAPDAVREIRHLQELSHPNIIHLVSVFSSKDQTLNLVLEYLPLGDLEMLIRDTDRVRYGAADIKAWMGMLTRGVWFCHANFVLHRDIKPNNLLIAADGQVKLADFGLARPFADAHANMTSNVITRWYRPPELLFRAAHYGPAVDVWSVGCVFAELVLRAPFLPGATEIDQVRLICEALGTPTNDIWPAVESLPEYTVPAPRVPPRSRDWFDMRFGSVGHDGVDLLMSTLALNPVRRISAADMLRHRWWHSEPKPTPTRDLPRKAPEGAAELEDRMAADLKRRPGALGTANGGSGSGSSGAQGDRGNKVARKLDFGRK